MVPSIRDNAVHAGMPHRTGDLFCVFVITAISDDQLRLQSAYRLDWCVSSRQCLACLVLVAYRCQIFGDNRLSTKLFAG